MRESWWNRRRFLKVLGAAAVASSASTKAFGDGAAAVSLVVDPADKVATPKPAAWAVEQLAQALEACGISVTRASRIEDASQGSFCIIAAGAGTVSARRMLQDAKFPVAATPEALGLIRLPHRDNRTMLACGHDARGLVYAVTELTDLVQNAPGPLAALEAVE